MRSGRKPTRSVRSTGKPVTVSLPRWAWDYLSYVALNGPTDLLLSIKEGLKKPGDHPSVTALDGGLTKLIEAAERSGRPRSAGLLREVMKAPKVVEKPPERPSLFDKPKRTSQPHYPTPEQRREEATRAAAPAALPPKVAPASGPPKGDRPDQQNLGTPTRPPVRRTRQPRKSAPAVKKPPKAKPEFSALAHMEFLAEQGELDEVELAMLARMKKGAGT